MQAYSIGSPTDAAYLTFLSNNLSDIFLPSLFSEIFHFKRFIKICLGEFELLLQGKGWESADWTHLSQDTQAWQVLVKAITSL
jgi:hypothetical protein